jgi:hypothetical protein
MEINNLNFLWQIHQQEIHMYLFQLNNSIFNYLMIWINFFHHLIYNNIITIIIYNINSQY